MLLEFRTAQGAMLLAQRPSNFFFSKNSKKRLSGGDFKGRPAGVEFESAKGKAIDGQQLRRLYEEHGAALVLYGRQWCVQPDDALQDALIDLAHQTQDPRDPVAWLFKTVRCKALNQARSEQRRSKYQQIAAEQRDPWFTTEPTKSIEIGEVEAMVAELPALEREIVIARIWGDLSFEQIAELVDRSPSFVYRRYQHTLSELEKKFEGQVKNRVRTHD